MYGVIQFMNGQFSVVAEGANPDSMEANYFNHIAAIINDSGAAKGCVKLLDENLDVYDGCIKLIDKPAKES